MPKKLPDNIREQILKAGREIMNRDGYEGFTMRSIARETGIGLGTAYNYFDSKEVLAANIILADWLEAMKRIREEVQGQDDAGKAETVFRYIREFSREYEKVWKSYAGTAPADSATSGRHPMLIAQVQSASGLSWFVTEILVHFATIPGIRYEEIREDVSRLLQR